jgi:hypothetical protein
MKAKYAIIIFSMLIISACAEMQNVIRTTGPMPLSEDEVVNGLKEELMVATKHSSAVLGAENGYFGDPTVKIVLPDDANIIIDNISKIPGGDKLVEDLILRINRAAEDAAGDAAPIFANSINQLTISDGIGILYGADNAATQYFRKTTYDQLFQLYKPKIAVATEKKIAGSVSAKDSWVSLTGTWNKLAGSVAGKLANLKTVNADLDDYLTRKALDGMFFKMELEELKIRKEVSARISPILQKVFGRLDK